MRIGKLVPFGRLDRYVAALFGMSYATAILLILGLMIVIDIATHLSYFKTWKDGGSASTWQIFEYYTLSVPFLYVQFSPFVTVVAGIFTVFRLVKKNELSAGLSAGVSAQRLLASVFFGSLLAAALTFGLREGASWLGGPRRDALFDVLEESREEAVYPNFMFRVNAEGDIVSISEYRAGTESKPPDGTGFQVTVTRPGVVRRIVADHIAWVDDGAHRGWKLDGGYVREVGAAHQTKPLEWLELVQFTPQDVLTAVKARSPRLIELSFSQLLELSKRDPDNTSYQTLLQYLLTFPLANVVLVLCSLPLLVGRERGKGGGAVMGGLLLCMAYFSVDFVTRSMGLNGDLTPLMSAWLPVLFFGALGISLTHFMRT